MIRTFLYLENFFPCISVPNTKVEAHEEKIKHMFPQDPALSANLGNSAFGLGRLGSAWQDVGFQSVAYQLYMNKKVEKEGLEDPTISISRKKHGGLTAL